MTEQHPLTHGTCLAIDDSLMIDEDDWEGYIRAGADWQLEQVIDWLLHNLRLGSASADYIVGNLKKAMRPAPVEELTEAMLHTTAQENN